MVAAVDPTLSCLPSPLCFRSGSGFFKAGAVRVAPLENIRAPISAFDPTTGAVCDQYNCTVIVGLECMQEGQKRCKADAFGNVGRNNSGYNNFGDYNTGYNNIGTFIYGSGNWGMGVAGVASIGVNETGVYNKLSSAWDLVSPLTVNLDESAPAPAPAYIPAPGPADVPAPVYAPEPETYVPEPDYAPSPY